MSDEKKNSGKVVKAGAGYVIGNYLLKGITFLSAPIFTRLLTTDEFGELGTYLSYESIFFIIVGLALHSSITNAKYEYKEKFDRYVSSLVLLSMVSAGVWLIIANLAFPVYGEFLHLTRPIVNILVVHCFATAMLQFFNVYVGLNYSVKEYMRLTSINALANLGLSVLLILTVFNSYRLMGRILGIALPLIAIAGYIVFYFFRKSKPVVSGEYWKFGISYSLPIIPHGISSVILSSFDRIMIRKMINSADAGLYSFAYTINSLILVVSQSLDNVWKPWFYERMEEKDYTTIRKQGTKYALGIGIVTSLILIATPEALKVLGDVEYWGITDCTVPVVVGGFFAFMYTMPVLVEYYYKKTRFIAIGSVTAALTNIVLNYFFIPKYGYIAAAYTTLITYFLYFTFHYFMAAKIHGKSLFSGLWMYGIALGVAAVGAAAIWLEHFFFVRLAIGLLIFAGGLYWANRNFGIKKVLQRKFGKKGNS